MWQQVREVFTLTMRWVKREPWMLTPIGMIWYATHTPEERAAHAREVLDRD